MPISLRRCLNACIPASTSEQKAGNTRRSTAVFIARTVYPARSDLIISTLRASGPSPSNPGTSRYRGSSWSRG